ncbi:ribosomal protein L1 [Paxillus ammoniavirescens]|nr:ribosomal protein L1 [Paxillus ammoniavirescens]
MAKTELIDSHVSVKQCKRAIEALHAYATKLEKKRAETELLPSNDQHIWLQIAVKTMQPEQKLKPVKIPIKYPLVDPRTSGVCLITKDPQREYKDLLEQHNVKFISRVVGIEKLKGKFKAFEARRLLLKENSMFLADERVIPILPRLLGSKWFQAKKQPIPVCLTRKDLKGELERAIESSYMHQNKGTCTSVKVGILSQTPKQIQINLETAIPAIVGHIKGGWDNVQSLHIKTNASVSLPIWSCDLGDEEGGRWAGLIGEEEASSQDDASEEEEGKEDVTPSKLSEQKKKTKRSKRRLEDDPEEPKKKPKPSPSAVSAPEKPSKSKTSDASSSVALASAPRASSHALQKAPTKKTGKTMKGAALSAATPRSPAIRNEKPSPPSPPTATVTTATDGILEPSVKQKKKVKFAANLEGKATGSGNLHNSHRAPKPILRHKDLKTKRSTEIGEIKKAKVFQGKKSRSAKDALLGKKAGQS